MNSRRTFIAGLAASGALSPLRAMAQPATKVWRVGFLAQRSRPDSFERTYYGAFLNGMRDLGYVEGRNYVVEWRFADGYPERIPVQAAELAKLNVDVIVTGGTVGIRAAKSATSTIPIVMGTSLNPVGLGFAASLARPGGNITGLSNVIEDVSSKYVEFLGLMVPRLQAIALMMNPENAGHETILKNVQAAAQTRRIKILPYQVPTAAELENTVAKALRDGARAAIFGVDGIYINAAAKIAQISIARRMPTLFATRENVEAGGLMSYGQSFADSYYRAAAYVDRIFKGAKPGDLPIQQAIKFELVINSKTAAALKLKIPRELILRADEVIE